MRDMFKYKIKIRPASEEDNPRECLLEDINLNDFEIRLNAMMADIQNTSGIVNLTRVGHEMLISTFFDRETLKNKLNPLFSRDLCHIRFVDLEEVPV